MILIINLIAAILLFWYPTKLYLQDNVKTAPHPFDKRLRIYVNKDLDFLVYSMLTAMVFLGPLSLWKYAYWFAALLLLMFQRLQLKFDGIVKSYLLFIAWGVISAVFMSDYKFQALMMFLKYTLPLLYLWLAYTAIKDKDDLLYFMKMTTIGMCVYAFLIGGFIERVIPWIYTTLAYTSGGPPVSEATSTLPRAIPSMEHQAATLGVSERVEFVGRQGQDALQDYYDRIDILLMPSRSEGFGLTAIEGMARGSVLVASDTGGLPEVVDSSCGLLFESENPADFVRAITEVMAADLSTMSAAAVRHAEQFSTSRYNANIKSLYSRLLS